MSLPPAARLSRSSCERVARNSLRDSVPMCAGVDEILMLTVVAKIQVAQEQPSSDDFARMVMDWNADDAVLCLLLGELFKGQQRVAIVVYTGGPYDSGFSNRDFIQRSF